MWLLAASLGIPKEAKNPSVEDWGPHIPGLKW